jgi:UDP-glucose 4-epimerase
MKILITGISGQVGSYLAEALCEHHEVVGVDHRPTKISTLVPFTRIVDIRDYRKLAPMVRDADAVIHTAAQVGVEASLRDPMEDAENNILGTLNLLKASSEAELERFIYFSSAAVFGNPQYLPLDEAHPQNPLSPYGISKLAGEKYTLTFHENFGVPATVIRPFNIYSPRGDPKSPYSGVITNFFDRVRNNAAPIIFGDGTQTRDFVEISDVINMTLLMLEKDKCIGEVFNCGTGVPTSINELAHLIIDLYGKTVEPEHVAPRVGEIHASYADITRAKSVLGYRPKVNLEEGLKRIKEHLGDNEQ